MLLLPLAAGACAGQQELISGWALPWKGEASCGQQESGSGVF